MGCGASAHMDISSPDDAFVEPSAGQPEVKSVHPTNEIPGNLNGNKGNDNVTTIKETVEEVENEHASSEDNSAAENEKNDGTIVNPKKLTDEEILLRVKSKLEILRSLEWPWNDEGKAVQDYLFKKFLRKRRKKIVRSIADLMIENGYLDVCVKIWDFCHTTEDEELSYNHSKSYYVMKINLWNYSDKCRNLAQACYEHKELVKRCMREFTLPDRDVASLKNNRKRYALKASLGFLMNIVRLYSPNVELIRANDGIQTIFKFYESTYLIIKAKVMMLLSFCINEEENEKIMAGTGVINFIVKLLKNALDSANHIGKTYAFSAAETVMGLDKLAANDNNKKQIVEAGVLPLLVSMLNEKCRAEEHNVATHCIWTLSFHPSNRENIREEPGLLEAVHRILQNKDSEPGTKCSCDGIVFLIEGVEPKLGDAEVEQKHNMHIMISYQWDVQATILQLRDNLRERGYKIWIDVDQVQGSILTEMASAVENAIVVIVAMTENYKNSNPCRTEAEYAYKLSKPIVPLLLQPHYKPNGWLGALLGMQLYVDLSNSEIVEQKFADVDRLIASKTKTQALNQESFVAPISETAVDARPLHALPRQISANTSTHAVASICTKWSRDDVLEWAEKNSIVNAVTTLCDFDGIGLMQLVQLLKRSPDVYYSALKNDFKMEWLQIFHLTNALEHLP